MKIIALYNIKGGVGKTVTSVNLGYLASRERARTLLCDLDLQGSASFYFRIKASKKYNTKEFLRSKTGIDKYIKSTDFDYLDLLPSDISYRNLDIKLNDLKNPKKHLKKILKPLASTYTYIFLDCPPNLTLLSENVFYAADKILVPFIPTKRLVLFTLARTLSVGMVRCLLGSQMLPRLMFLVLSECYCR